MPDNMPHDDHDVLAPMLGDEATEKLASVYGEILASLARDGYRCFPPRDVRLAISSALLAEAGRGERDPSRLMQAALSSLQG
jgi:hypothetical protein